MKLKIVFIICLVIPLSLTAQRHYKGVSAIEVSTGTSLSGQTLDPCFNLYYSHYLGYKTFYKFGMNYFDTQIKVAGKYPEHSHFYNAEFRLAYSFLPASEKFFLSIEGGAWAGSEYFSISKYRDVTREPYVYLSGKYKKNRFVAGASLGLECEFFVTPKIAVIFNISEYYSPMSKIRNWNTSTGIGIKYLIF